MNYHGSYKKDNHFFGELLQRRANIKWRLHAFMVEHDSSRRYHRKLEDEQ